MKRAISFIPLSSSLINILNNGISCTGQEETETLTFCHAENWQYTPIWEYYIFCLLFLTYDGTLTFTWNYSVFLIIAHEVMDCIKGFLNVLWIISHFKKKHYFFLRHLKIFIADWKYWCVIRCIGDVCALLFHWSEATEEEHGLPCKRADHKNQLNQ